MLSLVDETKNIILTTESVTLGKMWWLKPSLFACALLRQTELEGSGNGVMVCLYL